MALVLAAGGAVAAAAQETPASGADSAEARLQTLTRELHQLLDKGERERLADPWYLEDLRALVDRYHRPWTRTILADDFAGPGPAPDAPWQVVAGEFRLDWRYGLRTVVRPPEPRPASGQDGGGQRGEAVQQLFGALLNEALQGERQDRTRDEPEPAPEGEPAVVKAPVAITNAFALEVDLTVRPLEGDGGARFAVGVYQGGETRAGYRLDVAPDEASGAPTLRLLRTNTWGGAAVIDRASEPVAFDRETPGRLVWTRTPEGEMAVSLDGETVIRVVDRSFREAFDGLVVTVERGDVALQRVRVDGV